jgi:hypothetical protein
MLLESYGLTEQRFFSTQRAHLKGEVSQRLGGLSKLGLILFVPCSSEALRPSARLLSCLTPSSMFCPLRVELPKAVMNQTTIPHPPLQNLSLPSPGGIGT